MDGYQLFVKAGFNHSTRARGCSEEGIHAIDIRPVGSDKLLYSNVRGGGCGPEHIGQISDGWIRFDTTGEVLSSLLGTTTPYPTLTAVNTPTAEPTIVAGFVGCDIDMTAGGGARTSNNCWMGVIDGYVVDITTGKERYMGDKYGCDTQGFYTIGAFLPNLDLFDPLGHFVDREYAGCTAALHIQGVSGNIVTFDGSASFTEDLLSFIQTPIQRDHWSKEISGCPPDTSVNHALRTSTGCWQGVINGYDVFLRVGKEEGRSPGHPPGIGEMSCTTQGFYYVEAWAPDSPASIEDSIPPIGWHMAYSKWVYTGCSPIYLTRSYGWSPNLGSESGGIYLDIPSLPLTPTPTP